MENCSLNIRKLMKQLLLFIENKKFKQKYIKLNFTYFLVKKKRIYTKLKKLGPLFFR